MFILLLRFFDRTKWENKSGGLHDVRSINFYSFILGDPGDPPHDLPLVAEDAINSASGTHWNILQNIRFRPPKLCSICRSTMPCKVVESQQNYSTNWQRPYANFKLSYPLYHPPWPWERGLFHPASVYTTLLSSIASSPFPPPLRNGTG